MTDSDKLGLGLDDIIRRERPANRRGGRGGGNRRFRGGSGRGSASGFRARGGGRIPQTTKPLAVGRWKHDLYDDNTNRNREAPQSAGVSSTTKLLISNLDFAVTTNDITELFEDVGAIRTARVHFDESGRSLGTAEVVYERRADAVTAQKRYNGLNLDGRPMDISIVSGVSDQPRIQSNRFTSASVAGRQNQRGGFRNNIRQNSARGGRNQNGAGGKREAPSAEDLDADLDAYRAESKQKK